LNGLDSRADSVSDLSEPDLEGIEHRLLPGGHEAFLSALLHALLTTHSFDAGDATMDSSICALLVGTALYRRPIYRDLGRRGFLLCGTYRARTECGAHPP
jgi:hypothetical protein